VSDDVDPLPPEGPTSCDIDTPSVALVVVAHPDDAEFQAGSTLAKWARSGCEVHHLVLTDGSKGTWDPDADPAALVEERRAEQHAASRSLGGAAVHFLDLVDGELTAEVTNRCEVARVIREVRPDVVLGHDPWKRYRLHPDHRAAGHLCVDGIVAARDPGFHPELLASGLQPHRPLALLLFEPDVANHAETVEDEDHETRLRALECFTSQVATTHLYRLDSDSDTDDSDTDDSDTDDSDTDDSDAMQRWRESERERLATAGAWAGTALAEPFRLIVDQI